MTMYVRVCIDEDEAAARQASGTQGLGYAMVRIITGRPAWIRSFRPWPP